METLRSAEFDVVSVVLTHYNNLPDLHGDLPQEPGAAELEAQAVGAALAEFGGIPVRWPVPSRERNASTVTQRLQQWASPTQPCNTVLHWVGHGWSNDVRASLALPESDAAVDGSGLTPEVLASFIRRRERSPHAGDSWAMILIDGCRSARFVEFVHSCLLRDDPHATERVLLLGVSREGETRLGVFSRALELALASFRGSNQVRTWDLADQLRHRLPNPYVSPSSTNGLLNRRTPVVTGANAPLDIYEDLTGFIRSLSDHERLHLIPQASGAEHGDAAWYFVGRQAEKRRIAAWLKKETPGMLVVTGEGGQGKSALLGNIAALSRPPLRRLLVRGRYIAEPAPDETPPDYAFQGIVHATGMDRRGILESIARAVGYPAEALAALGTASLADSLAASLTDRSRPFTFLVDALDEAADPRAVADVLRWLSALPRCAVMVGTRPVQRQDSQGTGTVAGDLLEALAPDGLSSERLIVLDCDPEAVHQYVRLRLRKARTLELPEPVIHRAADAIAAQEPAFLAARLAVHELILRIEGHSADILPEILTEIADTGLQEDALFTAAMRRVMSTSQTARPLLLALALSEGRGMPRSGDVWASAASGISGGPDVTEQDIDTLLRIAAPYVLIDEEGGQAVYRLSHEVFRNLLITQFLGGETDATVSAHHTGMARSLAAAARQRMIDADRRPADRLPPSYVRKYLAAHATHGRVLEDILLHEPDLMLALDHPSLAEYATSLSPESAQAVVLALEAGGTAGPHDEEPSQHTALAAMRLWAQRTGAHRLAEACAAALPESGWALERALWSGIRSRELRGHTASVRAVGTGTLGGRRVIVSAAEDNTVRVWSGDDVAVLSAQQPTSVAVTRAEGEETVTALCDGTLRSWNRAGDERTMAVHPERVTAFTVAPGDVDLLYATAASLEIRRTHAPGRVGWHHDTVLALSSAGMPGTEMVLSGSADHSARLWDMKERSLQALLTGHTASVLAVALGTAAGCTLAATAGADLKVIVWDAETGRAQHVHTLPSGPARSLVFGRIGDREMLTAGCEDNRVRIWDAADGTPRAILCGHTSPVEAVAVSTMPSGTQCVSGSADGTIRLWDLYSVRPEHRSGLSGSVRALCWTADPTGNPLLLAADSEAELWTCEPGTAAAPLLVGRHHCGVRAAWSYGSPGSPNILIHGEDDELWLWDISSDNRSRIPQTGQVRLAAATVGGPKGSTLVTADTEGWVRLRDLLAKRDVSRHHMPIPCRLINYQMGRIIAHHDDDSLTCWRPGAAEPEWTVALPGQRPRCMTIGDWDGRSVVALGHDDGEVRLYDVEDGVLVDRRMLHDSPVTVLAIFDENGETTIAAGAENGRLSLWCPNGRWTILTGHAEPVYSLAFGPGQHLATGGASGAIALWHRTG